MNAAAPTWSVPRSCDKSAGWLQRRLARAGLRSLRTFDLHDARLGASECPCPHHGTEACDCQMMVLLVYGSSVAPVALVFHGGETHSWISVVDRPEQPADPATVQTIRRLLEIEPESGA